MRSIACVLVLAAGLASQEPVAKQAPQDLGALLEPIRERHDMPALGVAVIVEGKLRGLGATGVRKVGESAKVTADDLWHLGSCTKAMTATLLARQVEAGELTFETNMAEALPDLRGHLHASAQQITVSQLLRHRAGLPAGPPKRLWHELFRYEGSDREARTEVARALLGVAVEAPPGKRFLYSNASYMIAGAIAERAAADDWQQLMRKRLFEPLGMQRVGFGIPGEKAALDQPWGHIAGARQRGRQRHLPRFADNPTSLGPAGTVHASLRDWAKFVQLHLGVQPDEDAPLLSKASLRTLQTAKPGEDYAFGWRTLRRGWAPGPILTHSGSNTMWFCVAWLAPEAKFAVLVTCNHGDGGRACDDVAAACIRKFRR